MPGTSFYDCSFALLPGMKKLKQGRLSMKRIDLPRKSCLDITRAKGGSWNIHLRENRRYPRSAVVAPSLAR